jgi:hypothetical protein
MNGTQLVGRIITQAQAGTSATVVYTVAAGQYLQVTGFVLCNESGSAVTVSYGAAMVGGAAAGSAGTAAAKTYPMAAAGSTTSTLVASELIGAALGPGDGLWVQASAGSSVTYTISGMVSS